MFIHNEFRYIIIILYLLFKKAPSDQSSAELVPIKGGRDVNIMEFNYVASISYQKCHICSAAILDQNWLLTPAHCVVKYKPEQLEIVAGVTNLLKPSKRTLQKTEVVKIIIHEDYHTATVFNDIALIKTKRFLQYSFHVGKAKISNIYDHKINQYFLACTVLGWSSLRDTIQIAGLCLKDFIVHFSKSLICIGALDNFYLRCPSDLGGPLICKNMVVAIPTWNKNCNIILFTRTDYYSDWIRNKTSTPEMAENTTIARLRSTAGINRSTPSP